MTRNVLNIDRWPLVFASSSRLNRRIDQLSATVLHAPYREIMRVLATEWLASVNLLVAVGPLYLTDALFVIALVRRVLGVEMNAENT